MISQSRSTRAQRKAIVSSTDCARPASLARATPIVNSPHLVSGKLPSWRTLFPVRVLRAGLSSGSSVSSRSESRCACGARARGLEVRSGRRSLSTSMPFRPICKRSWCGEYLRTNQLSAKLEFFEESLHTQASCCSANGPKASITLLQCATPFTVLGELSTLGAPWVVSIGCAVDRCVRGAKVEPIHHGLGFCVSTRGEPAPQTLLRPQWPLEHGIAEPACEPDEKRRCLVRTSAS